MPQQFVHAKFQYLGQNGLGVNSKHPCAAKLVFTNAIMVEPINDLLDDVINLFLWLVLESTPGDSARLLN